jgi:hypothetical protein
MRPAVRDPKINLFIPKSENLWTPVPKIPKILVTNEWNNKYIQHNKKI